MGKDLLRSRQPRRRLPRTAVVAVIVGMAAVVDAPLATAGEADVIAVEAVRGGDGSYSFHVTVEHADEGWEHYADRFEILAPDGTELGVRVLHHPHVEEQPFTRSLTGVAVPEGLSSVRVRARDSVHGFGGAELEIELTP